MGEETSITAQRPRLPRRARVQVAVTLAVVGTALLAAGCGDDAERQDADEPAGEFPVEVTSAKFPTEQRLAQTSDLTLEIENSGDETVPDLAVTIYTGDEKASGPFSVRSDQPGLADANRPVWILEENYPKCIAAAKAPQCVTPGDAPKDLDDAPSAGAEAAQTDTFSFGALEPGDSIEAVWRVTRWSPAPTRSTTSSRRGSTARRRR